MTDQPATKIASRRAPIAIVIGLTLFSGIVHGYLDGRWSEPEDLIAQGERLQQLPETCGDWSLVESQELPENARDMLRCYGSDVRVYRNNKDENLSITVFVVFGPRGPIAVHTPEVCYDSIGTKQIGDTRVESISSQEELHHLWSARFARDSSPEPDFEVWYAWSDGGQWQAAKHPRFWMTENLYKIQLSGPVGVEAQRPCSDFLKEFLPQLNEVVQE